MFNWSNWFKEIFRGTEGSKDSLPQNSNWEKFMKIINNIAYIKYPPGDWEIHSIRSPIRPQESLWNGFKSPSELDKFTQSKFWKAYTNMNFKTGKRVDIVGGQYQGYHGVTDEIAENGKIKVLVNIFGENGVIEVDETDIAFKAEYFLTNIFKEAINKYPDLDRVIVEIFENIKDVKGYSHELCTISVTSTMENLKSLNWRNLSSSEVMRNIDVISNMNGVDRPFSSQYLYPETLGEKTISSVTGYDFDQMDPFAFEDLIKVMLSKMGFEAETTSKTVDGGIDVIAINRAPLFAGKYIIQCKKYATDNKVGEPVIRDLYGVVNSENANKGVLITTSSFSSKAVDFAHGKPIELIDGMRLKSLMEQYGIKIDYVPQPKTSKSTDISVEEMQKRREIDSTATKIWGISLEEEQKQKEVAKMAAKKEDEMVTQIKQHKPLNILIVEDEPSIRQSFTLILNAAGQHVKTAKDAYEGLKILEKEQFDLIFHDYKLPGMDGLDALKIIKEKYPDINVVIETAYVSEAVYNKAFELGAFDYLSLPFNMEDVYKIVERVMAKKSANNPK